MKQRHHEGLIWVHTFTFFNDLDSVPRQRGSGQLRGPENVEGGGTRTIGVLTEVDLMCADFFLFICVADEGYTGTRPQMSWTFFQGT